jgi:hypothetical protein
MDTLYTRHGRLRERTLVSLTTIDSKDVNRRRLRPSSVAHLWKRIYVELRTHSEPLTAGRVKPGLVTECHGDMSTGAVQDWTRKENAVSVDPIEESKAETEMLMREDMRTHSPQLIVAANLTRRRISATARTTMADPL